MRNPEDLANQKRKKLINELVSKTISGGISWDSTISDNVFKVDFRRSGLKIVEDGADYSLSVINSAGIVVDSFTDNELDGRSINLGSLGEGTSTEYYIKMRDLYFQARRIALGSDEVLDDILKELDENPF